MTDRKEMCFSSEGGAFCEIGKASGKQDMGEFEALLQESFSGRSVVEGRVVKGVIVGFDGDHALIDVGLKSEGCVPIKEFSSVDGSPLKVGDTVDVYVERYEDRHGTVQLSREKALQEATWSRLSDAFAQKRAVRGVMVGRVKGGFTVDLDGAIAFLPGSQVDIRPIKDVTVLMGVEQPFLILKMETERNNIVVSRRLVLEESRLEDRKELMANLEQGKRLKGIVKNITDYGAFIDLGGIDGLLHVTDIAWKRVKHPSDVLTLGQAIDVMVTRFNKETQRISLGMKQLEKDPWADVTEKYKIGQRVHGVVTNVMSCGAFVEIEDGVEGLVYVTEMAWTRRSVVPSQIVSDGDEVEVMVLDIDPTKRRISLGLKQCLPNPLEEFSKKNPVGSKIQAKVKDVTEFGLIVSLDGEVDGTVHKSDLSWTMPGEESLSRYNVGDSITLKVLAIDPHREIIGLGVKQLTPDVGAEKFAPLKKGDVVSCEVTKIVDSGIEVRLADGVVAGFIRRGDLSRDRQYQEPSNFSVGDKVDAMIVGLQPAQCKATLSIRAAELEEEKDVMAEYGAPEEGGTRLGDLLGAAMRKGPEDEKM